MGERMCHQTGWGRTHHVTVAVQRSASASGSAASRRDIMGLWSSFPREQNTVEAGHSTASETWGTASRPVPALTRLTSLPYLAVASPASSLPAPSPPSPPSAASSSSAACSIHPPHRAAPHRNAPQRTGHKSTSTVQSASAYYKHASFIRAHVGRTPRLHRPNVRGERPSCNVPAPRPPIARRGCPPTRHHCCVAAPLPR